MATEQISRRVPDLPLPEARRLVRQNGDVSNLLTFRNFVNYNGLPFSSLRESGLFAIRGVTIANRNEKITGLLESLESMDSSFRTSEALGKLAARWRLSSVASRYAMIAGIGVRDMRPPEIRSPDDIYTPVRDIRKLRNLPETINPFYNDQSDPVPYLFGEIFNPTQETARLPLSQRWIKLVDKKVSDSSSENIAAIDNATKGEQVVKKI